MAKKTVAGAPCFSRIGKREIARVAIAVVEGQRGEARPALDEPPPRLGERDEFEAEAANEGQRGVEERRVISSSRLGA